MTNENNSAEMPPLPMTRPARIASARRKKAEQTREWRAMRNALGYPEARQVDAAISEAMSFCLRPEFVLTENGKKTWLSLDRIFRVTVLILMKDGADRTMAKDAVFERLKVPDRHDQHRSIPSSKMSDDDFKPPLRRKDLEWDEIDIRAMKAAARPL